jgi:hypothetical protein
MVRWARIAGAVAYQVTRSVPPAPATVISPNPTDTVYYDRDVLAGKTYYYVIAGINDAGALGLKAGTPSFTATRSAGTSVSAPPAPTSVVAELSGDGKSVIIKAVAAISSGEVRIERADAATLAWIPVGAARTAPYSFIDVVSGVAPGTRLRWRARAYDSSNGMLSEPTVSNELTIGTVTTTATTGGTTSGTTGGTTSPTSSTPTTAPATGSTTFTVAPALSLAVGATSSLASLGGTRWVSMNEGIATVDASGSVTARAAGTAQIVALALAADGSLRVSTVRLTVTP